MPWPLLLALSAVLLSTGTGCAHKARAALVPQAAQAGRFHTVAAGENLFRLSQQYGVTVEAIARENGLDDPMQLTAGRVLFIPGAAPDPRTAQISAQPTPSAQSDAQPGRAGRLLWPVRGVIYSPFGPRHGEQHDGLDLAAPEGSPIVAAADGTVVFAGEQRGYGRIILVSHAGDIVTVYAHNRDNQVKAGDKVVRGQQLATVGRSGNASGPHLHFEVRAGTRPRDPLAMLRP
jgi:murein DD-endopeptidase MepM/ murein hydrolase activator NlpD